MLMESAVDTAWYGTHNTKRLVETASTNPKWEIPAYGMIRRSRPVLAPLPGDSGTDRNLEKGV